jgi:hypothetical protein
MDFNINFTINQLKVHRENVFNANSISVLGISDILVTFFFA